LKAAEDNSGGLSLPQAFHGPCASREKQNSNKILYKRSGETTHSMKLGYAFEFVVTVPDLRRSLQFYESSVTSLPDETLKEKLK
jgi:hypothetical protein